MQNVLQGGDVRQYLSCLSLLFAVFLLPVADRVHAQDANDATTESSGEAVGEKAEKALPTSKQIYDLSKKAKTIAEFTKLIEDCVILSNGTDSASDKQYASQLAAWSYNQRGELLAKSAERLLNQAKTEEGNQLDKKANTDFTEAIRLNPKYWKAHHNLGVAHGVAGDLDKALEQFNQAIKLKGDYANSWFNRAEIHYERKSFKQAVADYTRVIQLAPRDADARVRRAHALDSLGKLSEAMQDYRQAIALKPSDVGYLCERADAYQRRSQWQLAAMDYRTALRRDPKSVRALQGSAWLMATCPVQRFRNRTEAIKAATQLVELSPEPDHRAFDILAAARANNSQYKEAVETIEQAIELAPADEKLILRKRRSLYLRKEAYRQARIVTSGEVIRR